MRSHLIYAVKDYIAKFILYGMNELLTAEKWATKVNYLLEKDRLINDPDNYSVNISCL